MTEKAQFDIPILLPDVDDLADACVRRLVAVLRAHEGVEDAHVVVPKDGSPGRLCIHHDPDRLSLATIRAAVLAAGADITARFGHVVWDVSGVTNARRARTVGDRLAALPGVLEAEANAAGSVRVEFDRTRISIEQIRRALDVLRARPSAGAPEAPRVGAHADDDHAHDDHAHDDHAHGESSGTEMAFALTCGALLGAGFAVEHLVPAGPSWLPRALYLIAYGFGGFFTLREAIDTVKLRRFEIDSLMLVAAVGAAALGEWAEGALLLFLFSIGHALEQYAMGRARRAIEALAELTPRTALVRRGDGAPVEVLVDDLVVGDVVAVKPDERIPADGFVIGGTSAVNQAPITGESIPVDKRPVEDAGAARGDPLRIDPAHRVFAGTINGSGALDVEVTRLASDSTLARVVRMVSEAETQKSPTQRLTDRFERVFVPAVLGLAVLLLFAWVVRDEPFRASFYRAMAVLVAASPCALAIATPSAVLSGIARAARGGVLVKGGAPLENLGSLSAIAFDKTGTLTLGEPRITDVVPTAGVPRRMLLAVAVAVERLSDHPLARAIARDGAQALDGAAPPAATGLTSLTGRGVTATVEGEAVWIGKAEMFGTDGIAPLSQEMAQVIARLRDEGRTTMIVRKGSRDLGAIGLMDTPRESSRAALATLRRLGITRLIMLSGDNQKVASAVAAQVGIGEAMGDLMPEDKVEAVRKLRAETRVAMVGDGVNDAPAMASATVGIAMGAAGSDVALETADVALMADDLSHLPFAVGLSRHARGIIRQNVVVSLGVVALLVPATILGLGIGPAVVIHEGSTLVVVFNALRLLAYGDPAPAR